MKNKNSLLDAVTGGVLLRHGGEASVYLLNVGGSSYVLKWYGNGFSFDEQVVERASSVRDAGLYRIEEWGRRNETPYLIYDYIAGVSSDRLSRMPVAVALFALRQVASTLAVLRKQGVSHGDLNPANVILALDGLSGLKGESKSGKNGGFRTVVIDCGIVGPGALAYAAPERFQGKRPDEKSDLFSLGLLLYRWIAGEDLVKAGGYEQFAEQMANIDSLDVSEKLYSTGAFDGPDAASQLSALTPLWKGLLCADADERVEDLDELDELLEIALGKVCCGEVALATGVAHFIESENLLNVARKVPEGAGISLPFVAQKKKNRLKWGILGVLVFILILLALLLSSGTMSFGIDATGDLLLKRSRNMETSTEVEKAPNLKVDSLLLELPVPTVK